MFDFDRLQSALNRLSANTDAAEAHGTLCGLLLNQASLATWLLHTLADLPDQSDLLAAEQLLILKQIFEQSREQLHKEDLSFTLLLPDEADDFSFQLTALSSWCAGFLYAVGIIGFGQKEPLDAVSSECLADLLAISQVDHTSTEGEEAEGQLIEVAEHVRISVLILHAAVNPVVAPPPLH